MRRYGRFVDASTIRRRMDAKDARVNAELTHRTNFKSDMTTRLDEDTEADRQADRAWLDLCRYVDQRDGMHCRCCGRRCVKTMTKQADRWERHHVIPRSAGGPDTRENVAGTCHSCHEDRHVKRTLHIHGDAEKPKGLTFEQDGKVWRG